MDKYNALLKKLTDLYTGEINETEFKNYFKKWAEKNNYVLLKCIELLKDTACNSEGDIISIVRETENEIYYYDSCHRYCYLKKSEEGIIFKYIE